MISATQETRSLETLLRDEFPVVENCIYLNHAAVGPWPKRSRDAAARFAAENVSEGARHYPRWLETERQLRGQLQALIRAPSPDDIALLKNTSEALSFVASGFPWRDGDNVVISDEEFPSNRIVWESLRGRGIDVREVHLAGLDDPEQALIEAIDARTRLLSISSVQYASGLRLDLVRLGQACRERGLAFCVDAIQSVGALSIDVQAAHIDFLMADAHKWMLGPEGVALFYCRPEWRERLALSEYGWHMIEDAGNYSRRDWEPAKSARRFECGSPNMLGIHALSASLSLLQEIGIETVERRVLERARYLMSVLAECSSVEVLTPSAPNRHAGIVTFRMAGVDPQHLHRYLDQQNIVCAPRGGGIRFSPHFYVPLQQLEIVAKSLATFQRR
ncbi:MAG TPA: aminotransferase class V-fold PLP-dependent enzyme [Burkholderiales bacterium]|nr:aminotransferase class V-fold PLP-dependent enzyme [Burkholderiales bacterium]